MVEINKVYLGDNLEFLHSIESELLDLVYIDPPFFTEEDFKEFSDQWDGSIENYLNFMKPRIKEIHRTSKQSGSVYLHCDYHASHYLKILCDMIFGYNNFVNEIIWKRAHPKSTSRKYPCEHDIILYYAKNLDSLTFNPQFKKNSKSTIKRYNKEDEKGRYMEATLTAPNSKNIWDFGLNENRPRIGRGYAWTKERIEKGIQGGTIFLSSKGNLVRKIYLKDSKGSQIGTIWNDISHIHSKNNEIDYPTRKPEKLLERIILSSSNPGDLVGDFFCGSGTTLKIAKKLGRRYIGCDNNPKAIEITKKRLNSVSNLTTFLF